MTTIQDEIQSGLKDVFKNATIDSTGSEFMNLNSDYVDTATKEITEEVKNDAVASSSKEVSGDSVNTETKTEKNWDEVFFEKTGGKFKTWEEVEGVLNTPKDEYDEEIKHLAELKKSGIKFDNDFWELKTKDYDKLSSPIEILKESMRWKSEYKGWTNEEIEFELKSKYRQNEWSEDGEDVNEIQSIMSKRMMRDAENEKQWLIEKRNSILSVKQPDEAAIALQQEQVKQAQVNWEKYLESEIVSKTNKLSVKLDDKETFDFEVSDSDKREAAEIMKKMPNDINVFWSLFKDEKGNFDHKKVYDLILWNKHKDNVVKIAHQTAFSKGAEKEHKTIKNIGFQGSEASKSPKGDWRERARQQIESNL